MIQWGNSIDESNSTYFSLCLSQSKSTVVASFDPQTRRPAIEAAVAGCESHAGFGNILLSFHAAPDIIMLGLVPLGMKVCQIHLVGFFATRFALGYPGGKFFVETLTSEWSLWKLMAVLSRNGPQR